ncbi:HTH-type transcriptional repressor yvoA, partial [Dysosmobacter welbionis]
QVRVLLRRERVGVVGNPDLQGLDLGGLRHPVRHTQQVEMQHTADQRTARQHNAQALPAAPEHLEGLGQQHGGAVIPDGPCRQQADHHGQRVVVFPLLEAIPEQGVEELAAQQGTEPCHTVPEHRPQPAHGH